MDRTRSKTNETEVEILRVFRSYQMRPSEMLFLTQCVVKTKPVHFNRAVQSLIDRGMVIQERHRDAYSLTPTGYRASLSA